MKILILKVALILGLYSIAIGQYAGSIKTARIHEIQKNWDAAISNERDSYLLLTRQKLQHLIVALCRK